MKLITTFFLFTSLFFISASFSQTTKILVNSDSIIRAGVKLHDEAKYSEAINNYLLVTRNDTNYAWALSELALSYLSNKEYTKSIDISKEGLDLNSSLKSHFYTSLANALDENGKPEEALKIYKESLSQFPYEYRLWFNMGVTSEKVNKEKAKAAYQQALKINPFHGSSHYRLGLLAMDEGRSSQAMLSLYMYLLVKNSNQSVSEAIQKLQAISKNENISVAKNSSSDNFSELDLLLKSKIALNSQYKTKVKIKDPIVSQTQLLLEKLEYNSADTGFWMNFYVPFFTEVYKRNYIEEFTYASFMALNIADVQKWIKSNKKRMDIFTEWAGKYFEERNKSKKSIINGEEKSMDHWFYDNRHLNAIGNKNAEGKNSGPWTYYYSNGFIEASGNFENGLRTGIWKMYYNNGGLNEIETYVKGVAEGPYEKYHTNGQLSYKCNVVNGKIEGPLKLYNPAGNLELIKNFSAGKVNGHSEEYFYGSKKELDVFYKDGEFDGEAKLYNVDGSQDKIFTFANGKKNGIMKEYYRNGKLGMEGLYSNGLETGEWKHYHENGKPEYNEIYKEGKTQGPVKIFYEDGILKSELNYLNSEQHGLQNYYDVDGKIHYSLEFNEGKLQKYKFFNKEGKVVSEATGKGKQMKYKSYYPDGTSLWAEGLYSDGKANGEFKFYHKNGYLSSIEFFKAHKNNGPVKEYHQNGSLEKEYTMKDGVNDGYYKEYFKNKNLKAEGWYVSGDKQGDWYEYFPNGKLSEKTYYVNNKEQGYTETYNTRGFKSMETLTLQDFLNKQSSFDTTGKAVSSSEIKNGSGNLIINYENGKPRLKTYLKEGSLDGTLAWFHGNNKPSMTYIYEGGYKNGKHEEFYDNGLKKAEGNYKYGLAIGTWKWYTEKGNLSVVGKYLNDKRDSLWVWYYENGKKDSELPYKKGEVDGLCTYYSPDGAVACYRTYKDGSLVSYSYLDKSGNKLPEIKVNQETAEVKCFFQNGNKSLEYSIVKGFRSGKTTEYYENGNVFYERNYVDGELEGICTYYYPNGKIKQTKNYLYDEQDGPATTRYENGKTESEGYFVWGNKHGYFKYYSQDGKLIKTKLYRDNILVSETN